MKDATSLSLPSVVAVLGGTVVLSLLLLRALQATHKTPMDKHGKPLFEPEPPGPVPWLESMLEIARNASRFHDWLVDVTTLAGGRPWLLRALGRPNTIVLSSPQMAEDVFKTHFNVFGIGTYLNQMTSDLAGDSIVFVDGPTWAFQRKVAISMFSTRRLRDFMSKITHKSTVALDQVLDRQVDTGEPFDMLCTMSQLTREVFADFGFGLKLSVLGTNQVHAFEESLDASAAAISERSRMPTLLWKLMRLLNVGSERDLRASVKVVDENVVTIVAQTIEQHQRRQESPNSDESDQNTDECRTAVSQFIEHCVGELASESEHTIDAKVLRDFVLTMIVVARDTRAETMCWFLYCMSTNPDAEAKVRAEIVRKLPGLVSSKSGALTVILLDELQGLTYLEAALRETLRLYPVFAFNRRVALKDVTLSDGTFVPKDTCVGLASYTMGRRKRSLEP